jgi:general stress protein YciG
MWVFNWRNDMPGTKEGGIRAARTNRERHGKDFYAKIGAKGGKLGTTGGFAANRELAREAGRKGGMISRRRKVVNDGQVVIKKIAATDEA